MIQPRVIRLKDAPAYLGVNMNYFNKHIRPHLPEIRYSVQMVGFDIAIYRFVMLLIPYTSVASASILISTPSASLGAIING